MKHVSTSNFSIICRAALLALGTLAGVAPAALGAAPGWIDHNKNGRKDIYEDSGETLERRVADLLAQMTVEEKAAQLTTLYGFCRVLSDPLPTPEWKERIWRHGIGNIDEHLNNSIRCVAKGSTRDYSFPYSSHVDALNVVQRFFIEETRLGIPADFSNEGIRGLCHDSATLLPAQIGVGSTWNKALVREIGHMVGSEAFSLGYSNVYAPILDLPRDPRWGRIVECYGEDPYLVGEYGRQMTLGMQAEGIASTVKHFAVYGIPKGGRDGEARTDPHVAPRELHDLHLEPFRVVIQEAGALGAMSSYNDWDGEPITTSHYFLTQLLRETYGFKGYVVSDSGAVEFPFRKHRTAVDYVDAIRQNLEAGMNVRTDFTAPERYTDPLIAGINDGRIPMSVVDQRVSEVLNYKFRIGLFDRPYREPALADAVVRKPEHLAIARRATEQSMVLLKNDGLLPLDKASLRRIAVVGPNADDTSTSISRYGPSNVDPISVLAGIRSRFPKAEVTYAKGCEVVDERWPESEILPEPLTATEQRGIDEAVAAVRGADLAVVVLGDNDRTVGESVSRTSLDLPGRQLDLLKAVQATGVPTVLVLVNGRPISVNWADRYVPAILEAWFPGEFGGEVVADILTGDYNPGGRMPVTVPKTVGQIPLAFPTKPGSDAGQHRSGPNGSGFSRILEPLYPFGHGLSFTSFAYGPIELASSELELSDDLVVAATVTVTNSGKRAGDEVVQLYLQDVVSSVTTYEQRLVGFERIHLQPGESRQVEFRVNWRQLSLLGAGMERVVEPGAFKLMVGASSADIRGEATLQVVASAR